MTDDTGRRRLAVSISHVEHLVGSKCERLVELAQTVERAGAYQLVMSEHVALHTVIEGHAGSSDGVFGFPAHEQYPEPLVSLAAVAAVTSAARISTNVLIATIRPAVLLAKMAATLDVVSGGRLDLGVGIGWHREELEAAGVPSERLGPRLDDTIRACRAMWSSPDGASFASDTVNFTSMSAHPLPVQTRVPIWFAGSASRAMARRVVELGDGWTTLTSTEPAQVAAGLELIRSECERVGRDPTEIAVRCSPPARGTSPAERFDAWRAAVPAFCEAGVTMVQLPLGRVVESMDAVGEVVSTASRLD